MISLMLGVLLVCGASPDAGTTGFDFLQVAPTAREAAMGDAAIGLCDNSFSIWYNPANIAGQQGRQLGAGYISYPGGVQSGTVAYSAPLSGFGFGIGGYYLNGGSMMR